MVLDYTRYARQKNLETRSVTWESRSNTLSVLVGATFMNQRAPPMTTPFRLRNSQMREGPSSSCSMIHLSRMYSLSRIVSPSNSPSQ